MSAPTLWARNSVGAFDREGAEKSSVLGARAIGLGWGVGGRAGDEFRSLVGLWRGMCSGGGAVLVDQPAAGAAPLDRLARSDRDDDARVVGGALVEAAVGPLAVVVVDELAEEDAELAFVPDEGAVQELVAEGPDPSFGVGVRLRRPRLWVPETRSWC